MAILNVSALELIQEAATTANADILAEAIYTRARLALDYFLLSLGYTGAAGSLTSDPPNDTSGILTDSGAGFATDAHNGRQVVITTGAAIGNIYTITDTTGTTLVASGSNLYADGLRAGDAYRILYQFTSCAAHLHDGINGALVTPQDALANFYGVAKGNGDNTNTGGASGPTGYTFSRLMAWKTGRGGGLYVRISAKATGGSLLMSGRLGVNGSPVGAEVSKLVSTNAPHVFELQHISNLSAGDVIEFYADTGASYAGTWTVELMMDKPAFSAAAMFPSYL